jgi:hypothetical protein
MSVRVMAEVFARYPNGGSEMLLALALADHAHDDGTNIRPSVKRLATKTRQSERTVQYQLRRMEASGWLQLVANAAGGRNTPREYRINPDWLNGADFAPLEKGATGGEKGCNPAPERVQPVAPEPSDNHQRTIKPPSGGSPRGTRLPEDWKPTPELLAYANSRGWHGQALADEIENFRDYWTSKTGSGATKLDWDKTFRTWIRKARPPHDRTHLDRTHLGGDGRRLSAVERVKRANARAGFPDA